MRRRSSSTASVQPCEDEVSSSDVAPDARSTSREQARTSAEGPPLSTVSAAVTVTTRSVSTSAGEMRSGRPAIGSSSTRSSDSASCTIRRPRKRRRNSGGTRRPISRGEGRRPRPDATRIVTWVTPSRSSSSTVAAIASSRGSGEQRRDRQVRQLDHDGRRAAGRHERGERRPGKRKAERLARCGGDAVDDVRRRRRPQDDPAFGHVDDRDSGSRQERNPRHVAPVGRGSIAR